LDPGVLSFKTTAVAVLCYKYLRKYDSSKFNKDLYIIEKLISKSAVGRKGD